MKRKVWILVQHLLPKLRAEPKSIGIRTLKHVC